jgi:GNAT superfamily N-acetyltransferase
MNTVNLIAENFYLFRECFGHLPGGNIRRYSDVTVIDSGIPYPNWNAIITRNPVVHSMTKTVTQFGSSSHFPRSWWIGPETDDREFEKELQNNGFNFVNRTAAMAVELENVDLAPLSVSDIKILPVSNHIELEQYLRVLQQSFSMPHYAIEALYILYSQNSLFEDIKLYHYLGIYKGKVIGCASLFLAAGTAGIYHIGVPSGMRRRGIGKIMTIHCLKMARDMGFTFSVLRASNLGEGVYRQLGFKDFGHFKLYHSHHHHFRNYLWKLKFYIRYIKEKFTGDAIWFS